MKYDILTNMEMVELLRQEDQGAWTYVLEKVIDQEKRSIANSRKRADWGIAIESLLGQLYEEMVGQRKLDMYEGRGSLMRDAQIVDSR